MQTYSSLEPQKYNVDLSFLGADNEVIEAGTTLKADVDSVVVNWSVKPEFSANATDTIRIQMCYATPNTNDRPRERTPTSCRITSRRRDTSCR